MKRRAPLLTGTPTVSLPKEAGIEMNTRRTSSRRLAAGVGALALAAVGLLGTAAYAQTPGVGDIQGDGGTLTVHKFGGDPVSTLPHDGTEIADTSGLGDPLDGVEFTVYQVYYEGDPIDVTDPADWVLVDGLTAADVETAPWSVVQVDQGSTADGVAEFDLDLGFYLVEETAPGENEIVSPVVPFLVSIPYPSDGAWLYNVHVYPKNKLNETVPEKAVADPGHAIVVGDEVVWTITAPVPPLAAGDEYDNFTVTDQLDSRLTFEGITVTSSGTPLVAGDYTVTPTPPAAAGAQVVVDLTATGLSKIAGGDVITVELTTVVDSLGDSAMFENDALVNTNDSEVTTNTVAAYYGALEVDKFEEGHETNTLSGAEFELYAADAQGDPIGDPLATGITDANGELTFEGLWVGTSDSATREYVLVETTAPAGYVLPDDAEWTVTIQVGENSEVEVTVQQVPNIKHEGPDLPLTGATGTAIFTLVGAGLILTGGTIAAVRRSRSKA